ncbi:MAG TPA: F0F1 ATP synthase subunit B [Chitinispirillaceae bacterium]|nr:F0F1 ATP synthase subunit B [Chitinispirillaceae bacterium]
MNPQDTIASVAHHGSSGSGLFSIDPGLAIWTWVIFGLLFIVLRKYAWGPMMDSIKSRERLVSDTVDNARKTKEELEKIAERQQAMILNAEDQARKIIDEGRQAAEDVARKVMDRARAEAQATMEDTMEKIAMEKQNAIAQIKNQAVDLIINTSEKLIEESMNDETHRKIVKKHLDNL